MANAVYVTITDARSGEEVVGEVLAASATASNPHVLGMGSFDGEVGFANLYATSPARTARRSGAARPCLPGRFTVPYTAVYRFWAPATDQHFYTTKESEKDKLINQYSNVWTFEGVAFNASVLGEQPENAARLPILVRHVPFLHDR